MRGAKQRKLLRRNQLRNPKSSRSQLKFHRKTLFRIKDKSLCKRLNNKQATLHCLTANPQLARRFFRRRPEQHHLFLTTNLISRAVYLEPLNPLKPLGSLLLNLNLKEDYSPQIVIPKKRTCLPIKFNKTKHNQRQAFFQFQTTNPNLQGSILRQPKMLLAYNLTSKRNKISNKKLVILAILPSSPLASLDSLEPLQHKRHPLSVKAQFLLLKHLTKIKMNKNKHKSLF